MTSFADVETSTDSYAARFRGAVGEWFLQVQERISLKMLAVKRDTHTVLEVGGGHGQLAYLFAAHGYDITIVGSDASCEHRVKKLTSQNQARFQVANLLSLPFPNQSFDAVTCIRLLPHCDSWKHLIAELCRVAKHQVIVDYPPLRSFNILYRFLFKLKQGAEGDTRTFTIFSDEEIIKIFAESGFTLQMKRPQFFLPMVFYRKLGNAKIGSILERLFHMLRLTKVFGSPTIASFVPSKEAPL